MKLRRFKALISETGLDDFGASGQTFKVDQLIKDKIYTEQDTKDWDESARNSEPFFVDDNGCSNDIKRALKDGRVIEIFDKDK